MRVFGLGPVELIVILVIILVLFGPGRLSKTLGELGSGLKNFRDSLGGKDDAASDKSDTPETK
ncbi:MAG: hypothetical protein Fur0035_04180 [Anaerolineales bacterium]